MLLTVGLLVKLPLLTVELLVAPLLITVETLASLILLSSGLNIASGLQETVNIRLGGDLADNQVNVDPASHDRAPDVQPSCIVGLADVQDLHRFAWLRTDVATSPGLDHSSGCDHIVDTHTVRRHPPPDGEPSGTAAIQGVLPRVSTEVPRPSC